MIAIIVCILIAHYYIIKIIKNIVDQVNKVNADLYAYVSRMKHTQDTMIDMFRSVISVSNSDGANELNVMRRINVADIHSTGNVTIGCGSGKGTIGSIFQGDEDGNMTIMSKNNVVLAATTQSGFPDRVITVDPTGTISIVNPFPQSSATNKTIKIVPGNDCVTIESSNVIIQGDLEVRGKITDNILH